MLTCHNRSLIHFTHMLRKVPCNSSILELYLNPRWDTTTMTAVVCGFPLSFQEKASTAPCIRPCFLPHSFKFITPAIHSMSLSYRYSPVCAIVMFWDVQHKFNFMQAGIKYTYSQLYTYIKGSPVKIQISRHQNPTGHSMITLLPVLSLSSVLPPTVCQCTFILARKNLVHIF